MVSISTRQLSALIGSRSEPCLSPPVSSCAVVIIAMAREEELKRIDLKVNVSCCDGCRRKVMKAMSLKGVLRTEIQPSHDRVTVVGDVDPKVLIKKLAKVGKIAEVLPAPSENGKRREEGGVKDSSDRPRPAVEEKSNKSKDDGNSKCAGDTAAAAAAAACKEEECKKCTQKAARASAADGDCGDHASGKAAAASKDAGKSGEGGRDADGFSAKALAPAQVQMQHHYHRPEPAMVVPMHMPAYYPPAPAPYYHGGYYPMPPPPPMAMPVGMRRQLRPQPSRFDEDFFNDDNTVGCRVM